MAGCRQGFEGPYGLWLWIATTHIYTHTTNPLSLVMRRIPAARILGDTLSQESREWQEVKNLDPQ